MSNNTYTPQYFYLDEMYIGDIVFDESENISIFGYLLDQRTNELTRWDFFTDFSFLTDILLFADAEGDAIIKIISEKLSQELEIPTVIEVDDLFGKPLYIDSFIFKVYKPHEKDENGTWKPMEDKCLYIDKMENKETFLSKQPEKYIAKIKGGEIIGDLLGEAINNLNLTEDDTYQDQLASYLIILDNAFKYYSILLKKNFSEKDARKNAGLKNELLYRIAYYNNKTITEK